MFNSFKKLYLIIKASKDLDIYDLNYAKSSEIMGYLEVLKNNDLTKKGIYTRIISFFYHFSIAIKNVSKSSLKNEKQKIIAFVNSRNQKSALEFLYDGLDEFKMIGNEVEGVINFPMISAYLISFFFVPLVIVKFIRSKGYIKNSYKYALDEYILVYGFYIRSRILLNKLRTKIVFVSNDHSMLPRTFIRAAKDENIITSYIQHASISEVSKFPPLNFDYAFLDGVDSLLKYDKYGITDTKTFLIGIPKFDKYMNLRKKDFDKKLKVLGIASTNVDNSNYIENTIRELQNKFPELKIILRPHPGGRNIEKYENVCKKLNINLSNGLYENPFEFLEKIDILISGDSSLVLEAALMNVYPIRFKFAEKEIDNYGYIRNGLIEKCYNDYEELNNKIEDLSKIFKFNRKKAKNYCATIGTQYDGKSRILVKKLIEQIESNGVTNLSDWKRIDSLKNIFYAYRLIN